MASISYPRWWYRQPSSETTWHEGFGPIPAELAGTDSVRVQEVAPGSTPVKGKPATTAKYATKQGPINVCLVGYGGMGAIHARNVLANPRTVLAFVVGRDRAKTEEFIRSIGGTAKALTAEEAPTVISGPNVDAVIVATPSELHSHYVGLALRNKKAVLCEKPIVVGLKGAEELTKVAADNNTLLMCGFHRRFDPSFVRLKKALDKGAVGKLEMLRIISRDPGAAPASPTAATPIDPALLNPLWESLIHDFDTARWIVGENPSKVYAVQQLYNSISVVLTFPSGIIATVEWTKDIAYGYDQRIEAFGENGLVQTANRPTTTTIISTAAGAERDNTMKFFEQRYPEAYIAELDAFVDALTGEEELDITAADVLEAAKIAEAAAASIAQDIKNGVESARPNTVDMPQVWDPLRKPKLNIALIGCGRMGCIRAPKIAAHPRARLGYVVDVDLPRATALAGKFGGKACATIEEALADPEVDAIWISVPTPTHVALIEKATAARKPVFTEKPISLNVPDIDQCYEWARNNRVPLVCGWNRRFDPAFKKLHTQLTEDSSVSRGVTTVTVTNGDHPLPPTDILIALGSLFHDFSGHDIDAAIWLVGQRPSSIYVAANAFIPKLKQARVLDSAAILMTFPNGATATMIGRRSSAIGYDQRIEIVASNGALASADNYPRTSVSIGLAQGIHHDKINHTFEDRYAEAYANEVNHFVEVVLDGAAISVTQDQCRQVALVSDAALRSHETGKVIVFKDDA